MNELEKVTLKCNLKYILRIKNISANKLSNDIQERRSTLNDLINNKNMEKRQIPARLIAKLCCYLNVTPSDLFEICIIDDIHIGLSSTVAEKNEDTY